jgi:hypothetical protein
MHAAALAASLAATSAFAQLKPPANVAPAAPSAAPAAAAAPSAAPSTANADKEAAGKLAAQGWLVLLDRKDWGRAWETTAAVFRKNVPLGTWMDGIPKVRAALGEFTDRTPVESVYKDSLEGQPAGDYVTSIFDTRFGDRAVQEVVTTVREPDGKWRVTGYSTK